MLGERLDNRMRHVSKWARKQGISCFRLYEKDIPEFPMIVDWYGSPQGGGDAVAWFFHRTKDDTLERELEYRKDAEAEILAGLNITREHLFIKYRGRQSADEGGRDQYERFDSRGAVKVVEEHGLKFEVNLSDYLDVGLFLDHRPTRLSVQQRARGKRMLNLFSYTGAFSVHARAGGASMTTTVDMSKTYLEWYVRNLALNGFGVDADHRVVHAAAERGADQNPQRARQVAELRGERRPDERARPGDRREVVAEDDPLVRLHEVAAVVAHLGGGGPEVVEREYLRHEPGRVEAV